MGEANREKYRADLAWELHVVEHQVAAVRMFAARDMYEDMLKALEHIAARASRIADMIDVFRAREAAE